MGGQHVRLGVDEKGKGEQKSGAASSAQLSRGEEPEYCSRRDVGEAFFFFFLNTGTAKCQY